MNPTENASDGKYKRYDEAFKRQAVEHWMLSGKSARQIALELGVNFQSLQNWKKQFKPLRVATNDVQLGDPVFTIGFPAIDLQGMQPKYTDGKISSLSG